MSRFLPIRPRFVPSLAAPRFTALLIFIFSIAITGCGELLCPEPLISVGGACQEVEMEAPEALVERCDGVDNDGDTEVDEDWPELGDLCGQWAGVGECIEGRYVCGENRMGVVCEGEVGPSAEICDGKDNDCDGIPDNASTEVCDGKDNDCNGLVDDGVLAVKAEVFDDFATVSAVDEGFVVTRIVAHQLRVETYDRSGKRTGHHDEIESPTQTIAFLESSAAGRRVLVALGQYSFYVVDVHVDSDLVPIVLGTQGLHADWHQGIELGVYAPPYHPRVVVTPSRFLGYRDLATFALNPFSESSRYGLAQKPTVAGEIPLLTPFDAAGPFIVWEQDDNLRAALLRDDGALTMDIDVARGDTPSIAIGRGGPGVAYLQGGGLRLTELHLLSLQCHEGGFCNEAIEAPELPGTPTGPTALAFDDATDTWFVMAGTQLAVVGRSGDSAVVTQAVQLDALAGAPERIDIAVSGSTAAVVQASRGGESTLTFLGCF